MRSERCFYCVGKVTVNKKPYLMPLQRKNQVGFFIPIITNFNMKKINYQVGKQKHFPLVYSKESAFVINMTGIIHASCE